MKSAPRKLERPTPSALAAKASQAAVPMVGIGASAGGLEAFSELLHNLPDKTGMAYVLVQHLDPKHGSVMQQILSRTTRLPVTEVKQGTQVETDHVYVIPPNTELTVHDGILRLEARRLTHGMHMPIDHFFQSLAQDAAERAICVVLSGTGSDGTAGCNAVKAAGGIVFAQDERSAKYDGMPRSAINTGCADFILPPNQIARELARIGQHPYIAQAVAETSMHPDLPAGDDLDTLFFLLHKSTGVEFAHYKHTTLQRRIRRRMVLQKFDKLKDYVRFVKKTPAELDELYRDVLIHVTGFFREPEAFEGLCQHVYPALLQDRKPDDPVRIWVPGCSSGEEAYSIAISLLEFLSTMQGITLLKPGIQIFATDISEGALDQARAGLYSAAAVMGVSPERLKRFFGRPEGGYQINKSTREMCIFAEQNVAKDPPFSNLDLISCRNLLIYLGPVLQRRVIPILHYALKPNGYLMLGSSESLGGFAEYFTPVDQKSNIYRKKKTLTRLATYFNHFDYVVRKGSEDWRADKQTRNAATIEKEVQRLLAERFVPASIVVNEGMEIVQFYGKTGDYLEPASGQPTFSLSKMARPGLLVDLRSALSEARTKNTTARRDGVHVQSDTGSREIDVEVVPMRGNNPQERFYVVVFKNGAEAAGGAKGKVHKRKGARPSGVRSSDSENLKREAEQLRAELGVLIEEHETTTEEFKSANEEILSANEELQSTNEELETAKEELQSSNEELTTLNEEMQNRNAELTSANNDMLNLFGNVNIPVVMVSNDLRIRRFTPPAQELLNLLPGDIGRRLREIRTNLELEDLEPIAKAAIESLRLQERELRSKESCWYMLRARPYRTWDNKIAGAVISLQDIDALKRNLEQTRGYADLLLQNAREAILVLDEKMRVTVANHSFTRIFGVSREETEGRLIYELGNKQWDIPKLRKLLEHITQGNTQIEDFEVRHNFPQLGSRVMLLSARAVELQEGQYLILLAIHDITDERKNQTTLKHQGALLEMIPGAILERGQDGVIQYWSKGAEKMYGWTNEEAVGKVYQELLKTESPQGVKGIEEALFRTGGWKGELVHTRRDGTAIHVHSRRAVQRGHGPEEPVVLEINFEASSRSGRSLS
jgi:two-component system CheB/CheR fusion protein